MDYIGAYRDYDSRWNLGEFGLNLDGPVFDLPGGTVRGSGRRVRLEPLFLCRAFQLQRPNTSIPFVGPDPDTYNVYAGFAQVNVPIIGEANKLPLIEAFNLELGFRHDHYNTAGSVDTPKISANWLIGEGFAVRGSWGKAFRAPVPGESSAVLGVLVQPLNTAAGATANTITLNCPATAGHAAGTQSRDPERLDQSDVQRIGGAGESGGITISGGTGGAAAIRTSTGLSPEKSRTGPSASPSINRFPARIPR